MSLLQNRLDQNHRRFHAIAIERNPGSGHIESSKYRYPFRSHPPRLERQNLGALLLHDYIQKLSNQDVGDQIVIINKENLIPFYEKSDSTTSARVSVNMLELHGTIWQSIWSPPMISSIYFRMHEKILLNHQNQQ